MKVEKININFELTKNTHNGYYITDMTIPIPPVYKGIAEAKKILKTRLMQYITNGSNALENTEREYIFCADGSVLRVGHYNGSWGYEIAQQSWHVVTITAESYKDAKNCATEYARVAME